MAHALGGSLEGDKHTDTREAMIESYRFGFRAFEADLVLLADGTALVAHNHFEPYYGLDKTFSEATWEEVRKLRYLGRTDSWTFPPL